MSAVKLLIAKRDEAIKLQLQRVANAEAALKKAKTSEEQFINSMNIAIRAICDHADGFHEVDETTWDYHNNVERGSFYMVCNICGHKQVK